MKKVILFAIGSSALVAAPVMFGADASANYTQYCASCHGKDGAGHTKAGRLLKVRDLTDAQVQKSFTDEVAIKDLTGGLLDKDGNVQMKPMKDKISDDEIKALVAYVRTLVK
jgi:mono/diheme cytochrome c family protein